MQIINPSGIPPNNFRCWNIDKTNTCAVNLAEIASLHDHVHYRLDLRYDRPAENIDPIIKKDWV